MTVSRREFLIGTGRTLTTTALLINMPSQLLADPLGRTRGLQLYTVQEQLASDYDGTLRRVAAIGYKQVEMSGFFGRKPAEIKHSLQVAGLQCRSVHISGPGGAEEAVAEAVEYATELGAQYVISSVTLPKPPAPGKFDKQAIIAQLNGLSLDDYKLIAEQCNKMGELTIKSGVQFGYHNHNFEFKPLPDGIGYDELLRATDPQLVIFELDCGWMVAAGLDPTVSLTKYPSRYRLLHIKDFKPTANPSYSVDENSQPKPAELGRGHIDYKPIFAAANKSKVESYFVEQEPPFLNMTALDAIKVDYDYLRKLV